METINDRLQWIVNEKFDGNKAVSYTHLTLPTKA